mmetsp:Transcript_54754/g.162813  ORF Transcript_54754/g.162813 Transcript_54754/m.162813 type:complete len:245 (-) Transcript_54754:367-1101(-)
MLCDPVNVALGVREDDHALPRVNAARLVALEQLLESRPLIARLDDLHTLRDSLVGGQLLTTAADRHHHLGGRVEDVSGDPLHRLGPRGREEERLVVSGQLGHDGADVLLKAHVEHAISLVEHQHAAVLEARRRASPRGAVQVKHVHHAPRGGDDDFTAGLQVARLTPLGCAAVDGHRAAADRRAKLVSLRLDLHRQLTGWRHHQHDRAAVALGFELDAARECGDKKAQGLAGAGLRDREDVAPG